MTSEKGIPLYLQLKRELKAKIEEEHWEYGDAIPSENVLAEMYDVSVGTVRKGIQELVQEGYLVRKWGKGTYVSYTKNMSTEKRKKVVLIVPFFDVVDNADIVAGAEQVLTNAGYDLVMYSTNFSPERERELIEVALSNEMDGMLLIPSHKELDENVLLSLKLADLPVVLLDRKNEMLKCDSVVYDNFNAGYLVTQHLISQGKRRIAFLVNFVGISSSEERLKGYIKALEEHGLPVREELIFHHDSEVFNEWDPIFKSFEECDAKPDGIVTSNEGICLGLWKRIRQYEQCPFSETDIVSIGNAKPWDEFGVPLTTVELPSYELGAKGARLLMDRIQNPGGLRQDHVLPVRLIVRKAGKQKRAEAL